MIGRRFGRLVVLHEDASEFDGNHRYWCRCDCGELANIITSNLQSGRTRSCGCLRSEVSAGRKGGNTTARAWERRYRQIEVANHAQRGPEIERVLRLLVRDALTPFEIAARLGFKRDTSSAPWNRLYQNLSRYVRRGLLVRAVRRYYVTTAGRAWLAKQLARADVGVATEEEAA